jgi:8-oxo-dGTP pyrophosphatase MutT (NUDIX family)
MPKRHTYGIFLEDCNGRILVCTPYASNGLGKNSMTIPKGGKEAGESDWDAAVREFIEEAGIDVRPLLDEAEFIYSLPAVRYRSGAKTLYSFYIKLNTNIDISSCVCTTFTKFGTPEVYDHKLVKPEHAKKTLHESQVRALNNLEMIKEFLAENELNTRN